MGSVEKSSNASTKAAPAYVFTDRFITRFNLNDHALLNHPLPNDQTLLAEVGGVNEIFALTVGPKPFPISPSTNPADVVVEIPPPGAIDIPAVENVAETQPTSAPATIAASQPQPPSTFNAWRYRDDEWTPLPSLSQGAARSPDLPGLMQRSPWRPLQAD